MTVRTVKVSNVSLGATEQDFKEFFSFSDDIEYVEMQSGDEWSQIAYVTFKDLQGAETAMLLSGATIVDLSVIIAPAPDYVLPPSAPAPPSTVMNGAVSVSKTFSIRKRFRNVAETYLNPSSSSSKQKQKNKMEAKIELRRKKTLLRVCLLVVVFIVIAAVLSPPLAARRLPRAARVPSKKREKNLVDVSTGQGDLLAHVNPTLLAARVPNEKRERKMVDVSTEQGEIFLPLLAHVNPPPLVARVPNEKRERKMVDDKDTKPMGWLESTIQKAEDVVTSMLAKGFILGKDAVTKAKTFDEKHQLTSTATAKVVSLDKKIGLSEKITLGTSAVNEKVKEMDQKFRVSEKTKSAFAAAEQKVSSARSPIMKNRYVLTSASWVTGAFSKVAKAANDVGTKTKEKVGTEDKDTKPTGQPESTIEKAEDVVTSMLAKGFILGKDAVTKAKTFDEKHQLTSTATAKVVSLDKKIGLSEKITMGTSAVNEKVKEMDQKFQVSEKTKSAFAAAEQKVSSAGSTIMKNRYVLTSASWVTGAFSRVAKAANDVGTKTKEKVVAEEAQHKGLEGEFDRVRLSDDSSKGGSGERSSSKKPAPAEGLIL